MHVDHPLQRKLLGKSLIVIADVSVIEEFYRYLDTLRWFPQSLDWTAMPLSESFNLAIGTQDDAVKWVRSMAIGRHSHIIVAYKEDEPGLICTPEILVSNLGAIFDGAPGRRYLFGADRCTEGWKYDFGSLLEFDGCEVLTAIK